MTLKTKFKLGILRLFRVRSGDVAAWEEVGGAVSASGPWATPPFPSHPTSTPRSVPPTPPSQMATTPLTRRGTREVHAHLKHRCWEMARLALGAVLCPGQLSDWLPCTSSRQFFLNLRLHEPVGWYFLQRGKVSGTEAKSCSELSLVRQLKLLKDCARSWNSASITHWLRSNFLTSRPSVSPPVKLRWQQHTPGRGVGR